MSKHRYHRNPLRRIMLQIVISIRKHRRAFLSAAGCVVTLAIVAILIVTLSGKAEAVNRSNSNIPFPSPTLTSAALMTSPTPLLTPSATPVPTPTPDPTLKQGDENERVQNLQERLMDLGYLALDESTLFYGPATGYAVKLFQRQHGLQQDGIAGSDTLILILSDDAKPYTLLEGTSGTDVDSLQQQLADLGYLGKTTGYYGTETVDAVKVFQKRNGLTVDGKTGAQTLDLIYSPDAVPSASKVQSESTRANILEMIDVAEAQLGKRYILGTSGPNTFDCSGLVYYCLKQAGSSRGRYNAAGYSKVEDWEAITSMDNLQIGDLLFFSTNGKQVGHTGIYIGNGMMIDASSSNGKVVKRACDTSFWKRNFVVARRPW